MEAGNKISIRDIVTNVSEMVNLHRKIHKRDQFYDRFLIWWPLTILTGSPYASLRGFWFFSQSKIYKCKTFFIDFFLKSNFEHFEKKKWQWSVQKRKSYDEFRYLSGLPNIKAFAHIEKIILEGRKRY